MFIEGLSFLLAIVKNFDWIKTKKKIQSIFCCYLNKCKLEKSSFVLFSFEIFISFPKFVFYRALSITKNYLKQNDSNFAQLFPTLSVRPR
jgi:hypothetical protein